MGIHSESFENMALSTFHEKKILTIEELSELLHCSNITSRRRLKQWRALTSYNQNNRYYTLPDIPVFTKRGLWHNRGVFFSKYGTCKQTVIHFVSLSKNGLSNTELAEVLGENPNSLLAHFKEIPGIKRERHGRDIVYFSSSENVYMQQKQNRFPPKPATKKLPADAQAIMILVELIRHPEMSIDELSAQLQRKGHTVETGNITALFKKHGIDKKKQNTKL
ncbi:MAG: hypothetical protein PF518_18120 [Spirochaetaceae bacterium]|jgi:hypothetical protein|nr:hypothetical protein [Spirochaetaceae bacterium]